MPIVVVLQTEMPVAPELRAQAAIKVIVVVVLASPKAAATSARVASMTVLPVLAMTLAHPAQTLEPVTKMLHHAVILAPALTLARPVVILVPVNRHLANRWV